MHDTASDPPRETHHGARELPRVRVDGYNCELRAGGGFLGDRATKRAFMAKLEATQQALRAAGDDPFDGHTPEREELATILTRGEPETAAAVETAIEEFACELATFIRRLLRLRAWRRTERIVVGGGFRRSRIGEIAIGRTAILLKTDEVRIDLQPIAGDPDDAALIGSLHLVPPRLLDRYDALLAVDIGGTHMRAGIVEISRDRRDGPSASRIGQSEKWPHSEENVTRDDAVARLAGMLRRLIGAAEADGRALAPLIGIGCPGLIAADGTIKRGSQNLPGDWERKGFNLPRQLRELLPPIGGEPPAVVMHNDAVVQGLSEVAAMADVARWGVLTIGTGLGNARFTNI